MSYTNDQLVQRLNTWSREMESLHLPTWQELPPLELYMDQVILLLKQYLEPLLREQGEKAITASIINNYVRLKVAPAPVKKKYARTHLAYLIVICILKQSLSIASIQSMLPPEPSEVTAQEFYDSFVSQFATLSRKAASLTQSQAPLTGDEAHPVVTTAIVATLSKSLTERLLQE